ncbi:sulfotransferase family protein [Nonomuraea sp. NN258]|uniref:sulfotransferase family protein n=1 Tax=Nonomuraea antri TaxID=2730852 RepID=UPI001569357E|nr:sulfotransferase [Nonomuraea antri]NRQ35407.1 sulfotransferase family protein [Nonomuraea antri]
MRVIGAGLGRTGTSSLQAALERLGFAPCFHGRHMRECADRLPLWRAAAAQGSPELWRRLFTGYDATVDWPSAAFWRELVAAFPDAKVILTVRDPRQWYDSMTETIFRVYGSENRNAWVTEAARVVPGMAEVGAFMRELVWDRFFAGRFADRDHAIRVYDEHNAAVRAAVDPSRLLIVRPGMTWEPLCSFLGVAVPAQPYPHLNEGGHYRETIEQQLQEQIGRQPAMRPDAS